jgi:hypothetical protein
MNTNHWPHLSRLADRRGELYTSLLRPHISRMHVCDLNCGESPVFPYLSGYGSYYGNDVNSDFIQTLQMRSVLQDNVLFEVKKDVDVSRERIDVLLLLGCGGSCLHAGVSPESTEDVQTLLKLVEIHLPRVVMVEFASECALDVLDFYRMCAGYGQYRLHTQLEVNFDPSGGGSFCRRKALLYIRR